ncbi:type VI secretion system baseplate subunit TssK [Candidatus Poribacteria bacterium]|nr:type VI secretion system baseplate subunit TssK [Candidatus Poribacteria bacterium]
MVLLLSMIIQSFYLPGLKMSKYNKIIWSEGMFLTPHHFQQWDRYHDSLLHLRIKAFAPYHWGLLNLDINRDSLENGTFMILKCQGIFPEGVYINIPEVDDPPLSREVGDYFDPSLRTLGVYLTIPIDRPGSVNYQLEQDDIKELPYKREFVKVVDETTGDNEQEIPVTKKNLKILFEGESLDSHEYIKIAELKRLSSGIIAVNDSYIPACLSVSASQQLLGIIRRVVERLIAKSNTFSEQMPSRQLSNTNTANLWQLQIINSFIPELNHIYRNQREHPVGVYRLLARLAGNLSALSSDVNPADLPQYNHDDIYNSLGELENIVLNLLQLIAPVTEAPPPSPKYRFIPLNQPRRSLYEGIIEDQLLDSKYSFYIAVKCEGDQSEMISEIPQQTKIASFSDIDLLIGRALRGIAVSYSPTPATAIPRKTGYSYFLLDSKSDFWSGVRSSGAMAIYIPDSLGEIQVELIAVEDEE